MSIAHFIIAHYLGPHIGAKFWQMLSVLIKNGNVTLQLQGKCLKNGSQMDSVSIKYSFEFVL